MGGDPYFSHLSSPPPPGLPIFTLQIFFFYTTHGHDKTIVLYLNVTLPFPREHSEVQMKKNLGSRTMAFLLVCLFLGTMLIDTSDHTIMTVSAMTGIDEPPTPPSQPINGPGGSNYTHERVRQSRYGFGSRQFWIFEPCDPTPETAPLIVFNHGWSAFYPVYYKAWIEHLVKRGNIVVYPRYQLGMLIGTRTATHNAIRAVQRAISILQNGHHVAPDLEKFAIVGHSLGGGITAEMAVMAEDHGLPIPRAVMPVQPFVRMDTMLKDFHGIPASTLLLVIVGENDTIVGNFSGKTIFTTADQIPLDRKDYIIQRTDRHGEPALVADHGAPLCIPESSTVNAMDYYSTWKLFDALTDYAFYGIEQNYCLGNTTEQRFMGYWSDAVPVKELIVTDTP